MMDRFFMVHKADNEPGGDCGALALVIRFTPGLRELDHRFYVRRVFRDVAAGFADADRLNRVRPPLADRTIYFVVLLPQIAPIQSALCQEESSVVCEDECGGTEELAVVLRFVPGQDSLADQICCVALYRSTELAVLEAERLNESVGDGQSWVFVDLFRNRVKKGEKAPECVDEWLKDAATAQELVPSWSRAELMARLDALALPGSPLFAAETSVWP
jgi:hypothetical protein